MSSDVVGAARHWDVVALEAAARHERDARVCRRILALLHLARGCSVARTAGHYALGHSVLYGWIRRYDYEWLYVFGAVCPASGRSDGWIMPRANTQTLQVQLDSLRRSLSPDVHALLVLDGAGWHRSGALRTPPNLTLLGCRRTRPNSTRPKRCGASCATALPLQPRLPRPRRARCRAGRGLAAPERRHPAAAPPHQLQLD